MGILGALSTSVSGLTAQSYALENISGNIANASTVGFKRVDTSFVDLIPDQAAHQELAGSVSGQSQLTNTIQGTLSTTGVPTNVALSGDGFFVVSQNSGSQQSPSFNGANLYTRRGDFAKDANGYLVNGAGYYLSGTTYNPVTGAAVGINNSPIQISNATLPAKQTTAVQYSGNLPLTPKTANYIASGKAGSELLPKATSGTATTPYGQPTTDTTVNFLVDGVAKQAVIRAPVATATSPVLTGNYATNLDLSSSSTSKTFTLDYGSGPKTITLDLASYNLLSSHTSASAGSVSGDDVAAMITQQLPAGSGVTVSFSSGSLTVTSPSATGSTSKLTLAGSDPAALGFTTLTASGKDTYAGDDIDTVIKNLNAAAGSTVFGKDGSSEITVQTSNHAVTLATAADLSALGFTAAPAVTLPSSFSAADASNLINASISGGQVTVYNQAGTAGNMQLQWAKIDNAAGGTGDKWQLFYLKDSSASASPAWQAVGDPVEFDPTTYQAKVSSIQMTGVTIDGTPIGDVTLDLSGGLTQYGASSGQASVALQQDGYTTGTLSGISISTDGSINGSYSNGQSKKLGQVNIAQFSAADSLKRENGGAYSATTESGEPTYGLDGSTLTGGSVEASNTDISAEFSKMIVTQQAYSANTKVMSTAQTMLQDIINLVR